MTGQFDRNSKGRKPNKWPTNSDPDRFATFHVISTYVLKLKHFEPHISFLTEKPPSRITSPRNFSSIVQPSKHKCNALASTN